MASVEFKYLSAELYRHPGEREARARLEKIPGFKKALGVLIDNSGIQAERQAQIASTVRVGPGVYPELADVWNGVQQQFGLNGIPLHVAGRMPQSVQLCGGSDHPSVILGGGLLSSLPKDEMTALLAMQAGSIRLGNADLMAASDFSRWFMDFYGIAGAPAVLPAWGLENWRRHALFSADRAASLALGSPDGVLALLAREAGAGEKTWGGLARPDDLRLQGVEALSLQGDWSNSRLRRFVLAMNRQNTVALIRRVDMLDWFASGAPARILAGDMTEPEGTGSAGAAATAEEDKDPALAYWGEFAGQPQDDRVGGAAREIFGSALSELRDKAEKGLGSFLKAGEAFWNVLQEENKKN